MKKNVHETGGGSGRDYITILGCGSAIGERLPPYIVYKGKNLMSKHTTGGPPGTYYSMSDSGWMETANFKEWFLKLFLPAVSDMAKTGPVILFFDGHKSHDSLGLIELARQHNITLFVFPPHTTHLLQPMDVGVFKPFKAAWAHVLKEYKLETMASRVDRLVFPSLIAKMWDKVFLPEHIIGGFRGAGIHPLSRKAIPVSKLKTSIPFQEATATTSSAQLAAQDPTPPSQPIQPATQNPTPPSQPTPSALLSGTPVTTRVAQFFGNLFTEKNKCKLGKRGRTEPRHYGEALTEEEVFMRRQQRKGRRKKRNTKVERRQKPL